MEYTFFLGNRAIGKKKRKKALEGLDLIAVLDCLINMIATATNLNGEQNMRAVFAAGPDTDLDRESGDEFPFWSVWIADDIDGENILSTIWRCHSFEKASNLAENIARDRKIELVDDMSRA